jgi:hypothetical protein
LYIKQAFTIANTYAPNIKQIINQHGSMETVVWDKIKALVRYLRKQGLRVDGIGFQAHVEVGWEKESDNLRKLGELIDWAHANSLEVHITENNVACQGTDTGNWTGQAETFAAIVDLVRSKRNTGVVSWNLWHVRDSDGQKSSETPTLFFADGAPKPAYYKVQAVLEGAATSVREGQEFPKAYQLSQNFPNPFNPTTKVSYRLPVASEVRLVVYDLLGREVANLVTGRKEAGTHTVPFDAKDLGSGMYFYRLRAGEFVATKRMVIAK